MRLILTIAAVAALGACSQAEAPDADTDADAPMAETEMASSEAPAAWTGFEAGSYVVTGSDGTKMDYVLADDGTFTMTNAAGETTSGTLVMRDGKGCFTPEGGTEMCWTNAAPGPDGSWTATNDAGDTATITPASAAAE